MRMNPILIDSESIKDEASENVHSRSVFDDESSDAESMENIFYPYCTKRRYHRTY